jgi:hypothetical protein
MEVDGEGGLEEKGVGLEELARELLLPLCCPGCPREEVHPAPCTLHPAPCTLYPAPCTLHPAARSPSVTHSLCRSLCHSSITPPVDHSSSSREEVPPQLKLHPLRLPTQTPHHARHTLHPAPYTLHPIPHTLRPTPYTLHPDPLPFPL